MNQSSLEPTPRGKSHFLNLFTLAISDGNVSPEELKLIYDLAIESGISQEETDYLIDNPHRVRFVMPESIDEVCEQLLDFCRLILADGRVDVRELQTYKTITKQFHINDNLAEDVLSTMIDGLREKKPSGQLLEEVKRVLSTK